MVDCLNNLPHFQDENTRKMGGLTILGVNRLKTRVLHALACKIHARTTLRAFRPTRHDMCACQNPLLRGQMRMHLSRFVSVL